MVKHLYFRADDEPHTIYALYIGLGAPKSGPIKNSKKVNLEITVAGKADKSNDNAFITKNYEMFYALDENSKNWEADGNKRQITVG